MLEADGEGRGQDDDGIKVVGVAARTGVTEVRNGTKLRPIILAEAAA